ncbi:MAG: hypothetical protein IPK80_00610 [Nannocystis sp.]|nr:hypothetical protein [Nannocystis sp.]
MSSPQLYIALAAALVLACAPSKPGPAQGGNAARVDATKTSGAPEADTYNLRGAPVKGATRREEFDLTMADAQVTIKTGPLSFSGTQTLRVQGTDDLEILEASDGEVRKGRLNHVLDKSVMNMRMTMPDGTVETMNEEENGPLHGRAETIEYVSGQWSRRIEGPAATEQQARLLKDPPIYDTMYPIAVKVGESWTQTGPELRRWLGGDFTSASGEVKNTLLSVEVQQGEKVAVIESIGEIRGTTLDEENHPIEVSMGVQGTVRRSLDRAVDLDGTWQGAMTMSGEIVQDGLAVTMSVTGRYTARMTGSLR